MCVYIGTRNLLLSNLFDYKKEACKQNKQMSFLTKGLYRLSIGRLYGDIYVVIDTFFLSVFR